MKTTRCVSPLRLIPLYCFCIYYYYYTHQYLKVPAYTVLPNPLKTNPKLLRKLLLVLLPIHPSRACGYFVRGSESVTSSALRVNTLCVYSGIGAYIPRLRTAQWCTRAWARRSSSVRSFRGHNR